jgi:hypothetical protein
VNDTGCRSPLRRFNLALRLNLALLLIGMVILVTGCFSPEAKPILTPSKERFGALKKSLADLRGLPPKLDFEIARFAGDISQPIPAFSDNGAIAEIERAYKQLGLLSANDDFKTELEKFHRLERLIVYDSARERLLIAADSAKLGGELKPPYDRAATELPVAIGIVHALQQQHFQWQEKIDRTPAGDTRLAYRAIAGGDALLTALAHASNGNLAAPGHLAAARQVARQIEMMARSLPVFLRNQLIFPLREGSDFVAWAIKAQGRDGLNTLYANPPYTTAQILHPEKYFLTPQSPQRFFPAGLLRQMAAPALVEQSLGEFLLRGLLERENSSAASRQIAAGWRGDQIFSFAGKSFQTTAWYSSWGSGPEAAAFQRAFQTVAEQRHRMRLRRGAGRDDETLFADARGGGFALARKDSIVLYLVTSPDRLAAAAEAAWQDLEVDIAPEALRFDSAHGPAQLSLSKKYWPASFLTLPSRSSFSRCACTENSATRLSAGETST